MDELKLIHAELLVWTIAPPDFDGTEVKSMRMRIDDVVASYFGTDSTVYKDHKYSRLVDQTKFEGAGSSLERQQHFEEFLPTARQQIDGLISTIETYPIVCTRY